MQKISPEIAVIVVNYGTADLAAAAVESVLEHSHSGRDVEIHLVDNSSPGDDAARLRTAAAESGWGERVRLHLETDNHGFGRGNNVVLKKLAARDVPPDKVLMLNPDAQVDDTTIENLAALLDEQPTVGMVGCAIRRPDGKIACSAFRFPSAVGEFSGTIGLGLVQRLLSHWRISLPLDQPSGPVGWVSGAAMMARMEAIRSVDFFDPDFFLYYEEVEMMYRITQKGWKIWYLADTSISHIAGAATNIKGSRKEGREPLPTYWYDSWQLYFTKCHGKAYALLCAVARLGGWSINYVVRRLQLRTPDSPRRFLRDFLRVSVYRILFGTRQ